MPEYLHYVFYVQMTELHPIDLEPRLRGTSSGQYSFTQTFRITVVCQYLFHIFEHAS